ncbi:hypothetical protein BDV95DRAFT_141680 [Massariosphaeria phaeospora]|uniref:Secreted protein n=1 Tax=Massariosphaeria phaeospora TaxID=100035 RepID=A0A7C8MMS2_9PLEO|nr:hypothetical protein BDV95DRAFT_141680 [Massariosphaeria phaeospora]
MYGHVRVCMYVRLRPVLCSMVLRAACTDICTYVCMYVCKHRGPSHRGAEGGVPVCAIRSERKLWAPTATPPHPRSPPPSTQRAKTQASSLGNGLGWAVMSCSGRQSCEREFRATRPRVCFAFGQRQFCGTRGQSQNSVLPARLSSAVVGWVAFCLCNNQHETRRDAGSSPPEPSPSRRLPHCFHNHVQQLN